MSQTQEPRTVGSPAIFVASDGSVYIVYRWSDPENTMYWTKCTVHSDSVTCAPPKTIDAYGGVVQGPANPCLSPCGNARPADTILLTLEATHPVSTAVSVSLDLKTEEWSVPLMIPHTHLEDDFSATDSYFAYHTTDPQGGLRWLDYQDEKWTSYGPAEGITIPQGASPELIGNSAETIGVLYRRTSSPGPFECQIFNANDLVRPVGTAVGAEQLMGPADASACTFPNSSAPNLVVYQGIESRHAAFYSLVDDNFNFSTPRPVTFANTGNTLAVVGNVALAAAQPDIAYAAYQGTQPENAIYFAQWQDGKWIDLGQVTVES